jgi:hypothetical protein
MEQKDYQTLYDQLNSQREKLTTKRNELELSLGDLSKEIQNLEETMTHLAVLCGYVFNPTKLDNLGISKAVRQVLSMTERMSVAEIRKKMEERGFSFASYSAPAATLHTVLRRLVESGDVKVEREGYKVFYTSLAEDIPF